MLSRGRGQVFPVFGSASLRNYGRTGEVRGTGATSSSAPGPYSIELLAKDVIALLDAQDLDRVHFCGLSMGGMIGMWLGVNAPERLNTCAVATLGQGLELSQTWNARIEAVRKNGMKSVAPAIIERWFTPAFRQKAPEEDGKHSQDDRGKQTLMAMSTAARPFAISIVREQLGRIRTPNLVIARSARSGHAPGRWALSRQQISGARYVELNAAHLSNIEE